MSNQLSVMVQESGLEPSKAQYILENFQDYFALAAEWEKKAKTLVVTSHLQRTDMAMAREGRLFLREKRLAIESSRKKLKEQSLREGKAIDGIANVLKALIEPIEDYLERQERFIEIEQERAEAQQRAEIERRMEAERMAKEKAEAEERERIRVENERLKKEAIERDRLAAEERKKHDALMAEERKRQEDILHKERVEAAKRQQELEELAAQERAALEKILAETSGRLVECPSCHYKFEPKGAQE